MDAVIGSVRSLLLSHPLVLLLLLLLLLLLVSRRSLNPSAAVGTTLLTGFAAAALVSYAGIAVWYLLQPQYFDHAEPSIAAVSWLAVKGGTLYHARDAAVCYAHPYGPLLYFTNGAALLLFGPGITASKAAGVLAAFGSLVLLLVAIRGESPWRHGLAVIGFVAAAYLVFGNMTFWTRAESQLLFWVAASLATLKQRAVVAAVVAGVAAGIGANLKITAVLCFLPAAAFICRRHGPLTLALTGIVASAVFAAPFVLLGNVSFPDYLYWLSEASRHGFRMRSVPAQTQWGIVLLAPALIAFIEAHRTGSRLTALQLARAATIVGIALMVPFASKHGAGLHHFIPFIPAVAFTGARRGRILPAIAIAIVVLAAVQQAYWIGTVRRYPGRQVVAELDRYRMKLEAPAAVGYSSEYRFSFFRPLLVFDGHPYEFDAPALMSRQQAGEPFPPAGIAAIESCRTRFWLIPAGAPPFELRSAYSGGAPVFPPEFVRAFHRTYRRVDAGQYFDVWDCAAPRE